MITSEWKYKVSVAPASEPLTATEVKNYLKVDTSADDDLITDIIAAARRQVEAYTSLALISQTIVQKWDALPPTSGALYLARGPLISLSSITYTDTAGASQTLSTDYYLVDDYDVPAKVRLKYGQTWPDTYNQDNVITATYTAGYADADSVPEDIKQAMLLLIADMYENRTDYVKRMPTAAEYLMDKYRVKLF